MFKILFDQENVRFAIFQINFVPEPLDPATAKTFPHSTVSDSWSKMRDWGRAGYRKDTSRNSISPEIGWEGAKPPRDEFFEEK